MFAGQNFWLYLNFTQRELIKQSFYLLDWAKHHQRNLHDYSFIVMPAAKAFEGFLKQLFFDLKLIDEKKFEENYFRVGKALNPELEHIKYLRKECLFQELSQKCDLKTAEFLWQTWKKCRNQLFHYFANEQKTFILKEAEERLNQVVEAMKISFGQCKISLTKHPKGV